MPRVLLGLGSNLGTRAGHLAMAVEGLGRRGVEVSVVSPVYETEPVGGPDQGPFLNLVVDARTTLDPHAVLGVCRQLEAVARRVRLERWGPRTLDIDVLLYDDESIDTPELTVPHPRMWQRRFVVAPLADVASDLVPPGALDASEGDVRCVGLLDGVAAAERAGDDISGTGT
ncbi:MAG TPA: 2-amino-4-hydroxy-6-hydroxymethyldihydropteridine diphosphokinase [Acidimicrobiales bacterium]